MMTVQTIDIQALSDAAKAACQAAYCPYSGFPVGAAVLTADGSVFSGCNVENASYGLTMCAERTAVFLAVASGQIELRAILIYTPTLTPTAPCGACRQVLNEFGPDAAIICVCDGPGRIECSIGELLPEAFGPHNLA